MEVLHRYGLISTIYWKIYWRRNSKKLHAPPLPLTSSVTTDAPYIFNCQRWRMSCNTFTATTQKNHRFHFFNVSRTSRSTSLSSSYLMRKSCWAVLALFLSSATSAASSFITSLALYRYSGSTTSKYRHASLFCIMITTMLRQCKCHWMYNKVNAYLQGIYDIYYFIVVISFTHNCLQPIVAKELSICVERTYSSTTVGRNVASISTLWRAGRVMYNVILSGVCEFSH